MDIYDLTVQKFEVPAQSSTKDLQDLTARFAINFRLDPLGVVEIRRTQGTLANIVSKIIAPQTQESFKIAAARRTVEEAITKRNELKQDFDEALSQRLDKYGILVLDTSVVDLDFSPEFAKAVEEKQIAEQRAKRAVYIAQEAEQEAQADINRAMGKAEAQRLLAETLKAEGGQLVLQKRGHSRRGKKADLKCLMSWLWEEMVKLVCLSYLIWVMFNSCSDLKNRSIAATLAFLFFQVISYVTCLAPWPLCSPARKNMKGTWPIDSAITLEI